MKNGLYTAEFINADNSDSGTGIVVIRNGTINGGDRGYTYQGRFKRQEYGLDLQINVKRWNPEWISIFGDTEEFNLKFEGRFSPEDTSLTLTGSDEESPGHQMTIRLQYFGDLVE
jgi:T3SS negative regulator,GrlR